jgi:antitoxin (DNA-binding transcriptional repressor) of toxin-antitoxin stability system
MRHTIKSNEVRTNWAEVLRGIENGDTYTVEHYNRPVAELVPLAEDALFIKETDLGIAKYEGPRGRAEMTLERTDLDGETTFSLRVDAEMWYPSPQWKKTTFPNPAEARGRYVASTKEIFLDESEATTEFDRYLDKIGKMIGGWDVLLKPSDTAD